MVENMVKATCDICGESQYIPLGELSLYGWTPEHCPRCKKFKGKRPHNLSHEEIRLSIMTFSAGIRGRQI